MKEKMVDLLIQRKLVVNELLIKVALTKGLSLEEFLVLVYFDNHVNGSLDIDEISDILGIDKSEAMNTFNSLMMKGLVSLESVTDKENKKSEVVKLSNVYEMILGYVEQEEKKEQASDIFSIFEQELGRTLSPMELELINGWIAMGTSEEIIIGALKEAVYNNVNKLRYIDKVIYEWGKKGFKTMDEVNKYLQNRRDLKSNDKEITKKEQEISDYDWLGGEI